MRTNYKLRVGEKPIGRYTGYFLSDQLNVLKFNPKYDDRLFVELRTILHHIVLNMHTEIQKQISLKV